MSLTPEFRAATEARYEYLEAQRIALDLERSLRLQNERVATLRAKLLDAQETLEASISVRAAE